MNTIVIMADSWRFDCLGCYGNEWIKIPNINKLTEEGVVFEIAYVEGCPTIPTRRALFTGRYTLPHSGWHKLTSEDVTLTDLMWGNRIQTAMVTDCPMMHMPGYGYARGFNTVDFIRGHQWDSYYQPLPHNLDLDRFHRPVKEKNAAGQMVEIAPSAVAQMELADYLPLRATWKTDEDQMAALTIKAGMKYIEQVDKSAPFFLWLDSFDPHEPWDPDLKCLCFAMKLKSGIVFTQLAHRRNLRDIEECLLRLSYKHNFICPVHLRLIVVPHQRVFFPVVIKQICRSFISFILEFDRELDKTFMS